MLFTKNLIILQIIIQRNDTENVFVSVWCVIIFALKVFENSILNPHPILTPVGMFEKVCKLFTCENFKKRCKKLWYSKDVLRTKITETSSFFKKRRENRFERLEYSDGKENINLTFKTKRYIHPSPQLHVRS